jgi:hypothetical protein
VLPRLLPLLIGPAIFAACASTLPRAEVDRCNLGVADGNDAFTMRQGRACASLAQRLAADEEPAAAVGYARKSCQLEDARGCQEYLALVRGQPSIARSELQGARAAGEKACAGMVVAESGVDARPPLCARTAELYLDLEPKSPDDAGRLYARACDLGDSASCDRAKRANSLGVPAPPVAHSSAAAPAPKSAPLPPAAPAPAPALVCHDLHACVSLDVKQRNTSEVTGKLTNNCDRPVFCSFCPARGAEVDRTSCHTTTLAPGESKSGRDANLWYDGYSGIAFNCSDAADDRRCTP